MRTFLAAIAIVAAGWVLPASAAVIHDEAVHGDLSDDRLQPTAYTLAAGVNSVIASTSVGDLEYVTLTVPPGYQLGSLVVASYDSANGTAFIGVQSGTTFTEDPNNPNVSNLLGWAHFGTDLGSVGQDILDDLGVGFDAIGFSPPLPAGSYTYWIQQFDFDVTTYQFDFVVEQAPVVAGDINLDGQLNVADIEPLIAVLLGVDTTPEHVVAADVDQSGMADGADIANFVSLLVP